MGSQPGSGIVSVQVVKIQSQKKGKRYEALKIQLDQATAAMKSFGSKQKTPDVDKVVIDVAKGLETTVEEELDALSPRKGILGFFKGGDQVEKDLLQKSYVAYQSEKRVYREAPVYMNGVENHKSPPLSELEEKTNVKTDGGKNGPPQGKTNSPSGTYGRPRSGTRSLQAHKEYTPAELEALRTSVGAEIGRVNKGRKSSGKESAPYIVCRVEGAHVTGKGYEDPSSLKIGLSQNHLTNGSNLVLERDSSGKYIKIEPNKLT